MSHREAEHILRGELAVVEWRMATKYARLNKKIGIAELFPMKVSLQLKPEQSEIDLYMRRWDNLRSCM